MERKALLTRIALLYYQHGLTQQEIAASLGTSKMTVSRLLQEARDSGIVQIKLNIPFESKPGLARELAARWKLRDAFVVRNLGGEALIPFIGRACAFHLDFAIKDGDVIGVAWGNTLAATVRNLSDIRRPNATVVQLLGGLGEVVEDNPFNIVQAMCDRLGAKGRYFNAPAIAPTSQARRTLMESAVAVEVQELWRRCNVAVVGIGTVSDDATLARTGLVSGNDLRSVRREGAVGDVMGHYVGSHGKEVDTDLRDRLVGISLSQLRSIENVVAVAGGPEKVEAMKAVLESGCVKTLVTDEETALSLVRSVP
ncbi:MAG: sugar-binding transcriptional regulator [Firmicutes bacterium]|nr:sugar-binding transcriptional regulator [Bacillota bacterium]